MNLLQNLHEKLKRSDKKRQIRSSGSVPRAKLEKIRSGQSYLYQKNGMESEVFAAVINSALTSSRALNPINM